MIVRVEEGHAFTQRVLDSLRWQTANVHLVTGEAVNRVRLLPQVQRGCVEVEVSPGGETRSLGISEIATVEVTDADGE